MKKKERTKAMGIFYCGSDWSGSAPVRKRMCSRRAVATAGSPRKAVAKHRFRTGDYNGKRARPPYQANGQ